jgi:hypothetical protein
LENVPKALQRSADLQNASRSIKQNAVLIENVSAKEHISLSGTGYHFRDDFALVRRKTTGAVLT